MSGSRQWSLVFFTVLLQMAVGAVVALAALRLLADGPDGREAVGELTAVALTTIGLTLAGGVLAASFHLGQPGRAHRVVVNVGSSWLSREAVLGVFFGLTFVAHATMESFGLGSPGVRAAIGLASALVGLALIGAMSRIYMLRTVPAWNTAATPISFFMTALLLGTLVLVVELALATSLGGGETLRELANDAVGWIALCGAALAAAAVVTTIMHTARLRHLGAAAAESFHIVFHSHRVAFVLRSVLAAVGAGLFCLFAFWSAAGAFVALLGFVLVLGGELLARFLFYASHRRVGL